MHRKSFIAQEFILCFWGLGEPLPVLAKKILPPPPPSSSSETDSSDEEEDILDTMVRKLRLLQYQIPDSDDYDIWIATIPMI